MEFNFKSTKLNSGEFEMDGKETVGNHYGCKHPPHPTVSGLRLSDRAFYMLGSGFNLSLTDLPANPPLKIAGIPVQA